MCDASLATPPATNESEQPLTGLPESLLSLDSVLLREGQRHLRSDTDRPEGQSTLAELLAGESKWAADQMITRRRAEERVEGSEPTDSGRNSVPAGAAGVPVTTPVAGPSGVATATVCPGPP